MRTKRSIQNIFVSLIMGLILIIISFVAQKFLIDTLGIEYAGLNGLFTNIVAMLAIAELGLGSAIVYHLYRPLHEKDIAKISSIIRFYRWGYRIIAGSIALVGLALLPLLPMIVGDNNVDTNIIIVFLLFVANASVSYLLSYKRSLLYADQKNYIVNGIHLGALVVLNALQIWVLLATQNYYLYLGIKIFMTLVENMVINAIVNRRYKLDNSPGQLPSEVKKDIFTKMKGLIYHKFGSFVITGSSSIIVSSMLGLAATGFYSNYIIIQTAITSLFIQVATAVRASIGNMLVSESRAKQLTVFNRLYFAGHVLSIMCISVLFISSGSLVEVWLGKEFVFSVGETAALSLATYLFLIRWIAFHNFKEAAGIFYEDRFVPLFEAAISIIASIILVHFMGIAGIFIGSAISSLALHGYTYPKYVYKGMLGGSYPDYASKIVRSGLVALFVVVSAYFVSSLVTFDLPLVQLAWCTLVAIVIPLLLLTGIYWRSKESRYYFDLLIKYRR